MATRSPRTAKRPASKQPAARRAPRWTKSPPALIEAFAAALPDDPRIERRAMFGYPAAFANGHLFTGLHQGDWMVRLAEAERARLLALPGAKPFEPVPGRRMREYVVLPAAVAAERRAARRWVAKALAYVAELPAKR